MAQTNTKPVITMLVREALAMVQEYKHEKYLVEFHESKVIATKYRLAALIQKIAEIRRIEALGGTMGPVLEEALAAANVVANASTANAAEVVNGVVTSKYIKKSEGGVRDAIRTVLKHAPQKGYRAREIADALESQGFNYSSRVPLAARVANELKKMEPEQVKRIGTAYVLADKSQQRKTN